MYSRHIELKKKWDCHHCSLNIFGMWSNAVASTWPAPARGKRSASLSLDRMAKNTLSSSAVSRFKLEPVQKHIFRHSGFLLVETDSPTVWPLVEARWPQPRENWSTTFRIGVRQLNKLPKIIHSIRLQHINVAVVSLQANDRVKPPSSHCTIAESREAAMFLALMFYTVTALVRCGDTRQCLITTHALSCYSAIHLSIPVPAGIPKSALSCFVSVTVNVICL